MIVNGIQIWGHMGFEHRSNVSLCDEIKISSMPFSTKLNNTLDFLAVQSMPRKLSNVCKLNAV